MRKQYNAIHAYANTFSKFKNFENAVFVIETPRGVHGLV
jgi:hypothetical protein